MSDVTVKFETTRRENDELLLNQLDRLREATDINTLEPFARAYLGMFYEIDKELAGTDKVALLANRELQTAVLDGFVSALQKEDIPSPVEIGQQLIKGEYSPLGYVLLAGMDYALVQDMIRIESCEPALLQSLLCFHYSHSTGHQDSWFPQVLNDAGISTPALEAFWSAILQGGGQLLPGMYDVIDDEERSHIAAAVLVPVLRQWTYCSKKIFRMLLFKALRHVSRAELVALARQQAGDDSIDEVKRLYWHAVHFMLAEEDHGQGLATYCGRVKQKILPLLDFAITVLKTEVGEKITVRAMHIAWLLRIIAPIFPPQEHSYGSYGNLDVNSQNVMYLFYQLAVRQGSETDEALAWLQKARVMKIYADVIKHIMGLRGGMLGEDMPGKGMSAASADEVPAYEEFVATLKSANKLMGRSNRFRAGK